MNIFLEHDWIRSLRMASYGFLLYGPGSFAWYNYLDHVLPKKSVENLILKVQMIVSLVLVILILAAEVEHEAYTSSMKYFHNRFFFRLS